MCGCIWEPVLPHTIHTSYSLPHHIPNLTSEHLTSTPPEWSTRRGTRWPPLAVLTASHTLQQSNHPMSPHTASFLAEMYISKLLMSQSTWPQAVNNDSIRTFSLDIPSRRDFHGNRNCLILYMCVPAGIILHSIQVYSPNMPATSASQPTTHNMPCHLYIGYYTHIYSTIRTVCMLHTLYANIHTYI